MSVELAEEQSIDVDTGPARLSSAVATLAAGVAVLTSAPLSVFALPLGLGGFAVFFAALFGSGSRSLLWVGTVGIFAGAVVAGAMAAAPPALLLTSVAAMVLAWDIGQNAISVGEQLGRGAATWRIEVVHAAASTVAAVLMVVATYAVFWIGTGGQPITALLLLLAAGLLLTWALQSSA